VTSWACFRLDGLTILFLPFKFFFSENHVVKSMYLSYFLFTCNASVDRSCNEILNSEKKNVYAIEKNMHAHTSTQVKA